MLRSPKSSSPFFSTRILPRYAQLFKTLHLGGDGVVRMSTAAGSQPSPAEYCISIIPFLTKLDHLVVSPEATRELSEVLSNPDLVHVLQTAAERITSLTTYCVDSETNLKLLQLLPNLRKLELGGGYAFRRDTAVWKSIAQNIAGRKLDHLVLRIDNENSRPERMFLSEVLGAAQWQSASTLKTLTLQISALDTEWHPFVSRLGATLQSLNLIFIGQTTHVKLEPLNLPNLVHLRLRLKLGQGSQSALYSLLDTFAQTPVQDLEVAPSVDNRINEIDLHVISAHTRAYSKLRRVTVASGQASMAQENLFSLKTRLEKRGIDFDPQYSEAQAGLWSADEPSDRVGRTKQALYDVRTGLDWASTLAERSELMGDWEKALELRKAMEKLWELRRLERF